MKTFTKNRVALLLCLSFLKAPLLGVTIATGNGTNGTTTFDTGTVNTMTMDPATGTVYVGLTANAATNTFAVAKCLRPTGNATPAFTGIAGANVPDLLISDLTYFTMTPGGQGMLAFQSGALPNTVLDVMREDGTRYAQTAALQDVAGDCEKIHAIAGDQLGHVFAVVGTTNDTVWAQANDGIATVTVTDADPVTFALGATLDIDGAHFGNTSVGGAPTITNATAICYTPHMGGRLYVGASALTAATGDDSTFGVVAASVSSTGVLAALTLTGNDAVCTATVLSTTPLAVENAAGATQSVTITKLGVMETSTGFYYLISCGGPEANGQQGHSRNKVYALPLVSGNETDATNGTLASTDLTTPDFTTQCTLQAHMGLITDADVLVGGGNLPIVANDADIFVSKLQIIGDTVFIGISSDVSDATNKGGIYYSQAIFNHHGKIVSWTDWERAVPSATSGLGVSDGSTEMFAIDAAGARVWSNSSGALGIPSSVIRCSQWNTTTTSSFNSAANTILNGPCYSTLDLGKSVRNFGDAVVGRYALFGGDNKVVITRYSVGGAAAHLSVDAEPTDWTAAATAPVSISLGLENVGPITALGWTSQDVDVANNFLLAGTTKGLYAYAATAAAKADRLGFDTNLTIAGVNAAPFAGTYTWYEVGLGIPNTEHVLQIVSENGTTFIHTRTTANVDKVYQYVGADGDLNLNVLDTAANFVVIAQTGSGDFVGISQFSNIGLIANNVAGTENQLVITTDRGVMMSTLENGIQAAATADTANFIRISDDQPYTNLQTASRSRAPHTFWATKSERGKFNPQNQLVQFCITTAIEGAPIVRMLPANYNSNTATLNRFGSFNTIGGAYLNTMNGGFYTDGGLRFRLSSNHSGTAPHNRVDLLPFNVGVNTIAGGTNQTTAVDIMQNDLTADSATVYYWAQRVGGRMMLGTDKGIITLE